MRSNGALPMTDTRRLSPQTTSSSGYHSEFSSTNESPQSIQEVLSLPIEQVSSISSSISKVSQEHKPSSTKSLARISSFLRQQYERAKSKFIPPKRIVTTCTKATSTSPLPARSTNTTNASTSHPSYSSGLNYRESSFVEPVSSRSLYDNPVDLPSNNYSAIHECYSQQPHLLSSSTRNNSQINGHSSHSSRRLATLSNYENASAGQRSMNNQQPRRRQHDSTTKQTLPQSYFPYRYLMNHYDPHRSTYAPLSDFLGTNTLSAFKPIERKRFHPRPLEHLSDALPLSDDPCDLEVAHYFQQTSQCSNPNYFDIYAQNLPAPAVSLFRQNLAETLC